MAKFRILALFAFLVSSAQLCAGSILSVNGGVYSRVTARIDADAVPSAWDARTRGVARASAKG